MEREVFTTYETARICSVHHTTVINWVKEGSLKAYTTPGGHRRIKKEHLLDFMHKYHLPIPERLEHKTKRVLIVDDDVDALTEYKEALSGHAFEIETASSGFEAGCTIYKNKPDLILLDFKMPGMDGFEVAQMLHDDKTTGHIPIIAVTVLRQEDDIKRIKKCGVKMYISKPVDMDKLIAVIKSTLKIESADTQVYAV